MDGEDLTRYREASEAIFSGGTLLEAQTGLEISLNVDGNTTSGSGGSGVGNGEQGTDSNGNMVNHSHNTANPRGGMPSAQHPGRSTPPRVTESSQLAQAGRLVPTGEYQGTSQDSTGSVESGRGLRNAPVSSEIGSSSVGGSKHALSGPEDGDSRGGGGGGGGSGSGGTAGVVEGAGGGCRCGCHERLSAASAFAERVRKGLFIAVGYTCSAGIGCSKMTAKLAGELHKPDQQTTILPEHAMSMITQLPLRKLPGCGYSTCAKIKTEFGITESRQLQGAPWPLLVKAVGTKLARVLFLLCRGEDSTPVLPSVRPKTMSDEDSFKRGTVRSRRQVEHHVRRLAIPLLKRAGERARLHKEAPETLRFGFRRASKGYGVRVSRQCPVSSGVAAAFAVLPPAAAAAVVTGASAAGTRQKQQPETAATEAALSEAVRLVMALFDKMVHPEEEEKGTLDLTLLSVGLAGFRGLGGGAQSGMARYLEAPQPSRPTGGSSGPARSSTSQTKTRGNNEGAAAFDSTAAAHSTGSALPSPQLPLRDKRSSSPAPASSNSMDRPRLDGNNSPAGLSAPAPRLCTSEPRSVAAVAASGAAINGSTVDSATAAAAVTSGGDGESSRAAAASGKKRRLRPVENPYRVAQPQRRQERHRHREGGGGTQTPRLERDGLGDRLVNETAAAAAAAAATTSGPATSVSRADADGGASEHDEWYGAEVLVVGEGGRTVVGRGGLEWCGPCGAHVLRSDREEHASSGFHQARVQRSRLRLQK
ncbi:conserved unknown protein [Ectocarpus siliculosus]|uniref:UmuC domain-containing protein n=1 Tax=Ectocarpus siliculosus TaxID=2880 RepID=D7FLP2_ECTSI|nr:conserved unknown protein [Ectocarpus siliculosus]|eukprot:CBJ25858.1 conserved unknown protein [Ectocarpus siliculosus]